MSYKSKRNGALILMLIGIGSIITTLKKLNSRDLRNAEVVLLISGVILFGIGIYAMMRNNKNREAN